MSHVFLLESCRFAYSEGHKQLSLYKVFGRYYQDNPQKISIVAGCQ